MILKDLDHIRYRRLFFSVDEYFVSEKSSLTADINYYIQSPSNVGEALEEFYTLLIDLHQPLEKIREGIYHRTLSEINSFLNNQNFEHRILQTISDVELDKFINLFNRFASRKKIRKAETFRLKAYNKAGILGISYIKQGDELLCVNFYRVTKDRAANISSFSSDTTAVNSSQLGRAHRALHWLDIFEFKTLGVACYDFCGWYAGQTDKQLLNINAFKEQFTHNKAKEYSGVIYKNKLLLLLKKLRG